MKSLNKEEIISIICLYLILATNAWELFIENELLCYFLNVVCRIGFIVYLLIKFKKYNLFVKENKWSIKDLVYLPFLILCFSNYFTLIGSNEKAHQITLFYIIRQVNLCLLVSIAEELVFRYIIVNKLKDLSNIKIILYSSLIFGGVHLFNISSFSSIPIVLMQCGYSFFLGLVLSLVYLCSNKIIYPMIIHFMFNLFNGLLFEELFTINYDVKYFLINIAVGLLVFLYGAFIYKNKFKQKLNSNINQ